MAIANRVDVDRFVAEGYLVVDNAVDPELDLDPVVAEYEKLLDELATKWHAEGKLPSAYADLPFGERLSRIIQHPGANYYSHLDIALPQAGVREDTPIHLGPATFNMLRSPRLLDAVEQIVGPEIFSNPIQHVRIKPPERFVPDAHRNALTAQTDWHQDQGVALPEADETPILTVWLPVFDAPVEAGCLQVVPASHREGLATHCPSRASTGKGTLHIPDELLGGDPVAVPMKRGQALFMHRRTKHASLRNVSDDIRWSFDLRFHAVGLPTGRPAFPGFVARSRSNPASELTDAQIWADMWRGARSRLALINMGKFNRWEGGQQICA